MIVVDVILWLIAAYLIAGSLFGAAFVAIGLQRVDPAARGASVAFRLIILPGVVALWPVMLKAWLARVRSEARS